MAHKGQTAEAESAGTDSKLTKSQRLVRTRKSTHAHTQVWKVLEKRLSQKEETNPASHKGEDLRRCTKVEETVRRR